MLFQQQNPHGVSWSLQQQVGTFEPDTKPFSIRKYVLASRCKDIFHSWPFPVKYLQVCLNHGINNVLPPLEPCNSDIQTLSKGAGLSCSQEYKEDGGSFDKKITVRQAEIITDEPGLFLDEKDCHTSVLGNSCKQEDKNHLSSNTISDYMVPINQCLTSIRSSHHQVDQSFKSPSYSQRLRRKRKTRKGKRKKRSMVDILAVAKHCTLDDLFRISRLSCGWLKSTDNEGLK